jgi:cyanate permease
MRKKIDTGVYSISVNAFASVASGTAPRIIASMIDATSRTPAESWQYALIVVAVLALTAALLLAVSNAAVYFINKVK